MNKKIVTLSDTSHPYHAVVTEPAYFPGQDKTDKPSRILSRQEFSAIQAFQLDWGYSDNGEFGSELVDMLLDVDTSVKLLIERFMAGWDLNRDGFANAIRTDLQNLFVLRTTVTTPRVDETERVDELLNLLESDENTPSWHNDPKHNNPDYDHKPEFSADEVKALESLEGEKSDMYDENVHNWDKVVQNERAELFKEEADKRVNRYFIGRTGWAWFVHFIVDMPEFYDEIHPLKVLLPAKDGMTTLHMTNLFMTEESAWDSINQDIRELTSYSRDTLTYVVELDKL